MANPETREEYIGIPSGIGDLDKMITGLNKSDLIILGARPGMGKTSFALNIARNVAVNAGKTVCFFSLEMTRDQLAQRMLSSEAGIKSEKLRTGELDADEWTRLAQAGDNLSKANIYFDETSAITVPEMKAKLRRMKKVDLVIIDYLGLMKSAKATENRVQEVSEITRNLKIMAKELKVPVIACAQLSRGTETKGKSHKPALSDLRESGSIEQDADIVLFLYRDTYYDSEKADDEDRSDPNKAECIVAKNRHGEIGTIDMHWDGQFTRFTSVDVFRQ
jgi:replicative DNA helicase